MLFEIATLSGSVFAFKEALPGARAWVQEATGGDLLGIWHTDIGSIGDLLILRSFSDTEQLGVERRRALSSENPFGAASAKLKLTMESYAPFPFLPEPTSRDYGGVFEFRTYFQTPGGVPGTMQAWKAALGPAHAYADHLVTAMYALDGAPRITHIWGFASVEERIRLRQDHYAAGLWPPKGGPERIDHATSTIALAEKGLPIC